MGRGQAEKPGRFFADPWSRSVPLFGCEDFNSITRSGSRLGQGSDRQFNDTRGILSAETDPKGRQCGNRFYHGTPGIQKNEVDRETHPNGMNRSTG